MQYDDCEIPRQCKLSEATIQRLEGHWGKKVVQPFDEPCTNLSVSGATIKQYKCWCASGRRHPNFVKRQFVQYSQCTYMEVCTECGIVFSDVDDVSIPSIGDATNRVGHNQEFENACA